MVWPPSTTVSYMVDVSRYPLTSFALQAVCTVAEGSLGVSVKAPMQPCLVLRGVSVKAPMQPCLILRGVSVKAPMQPCLVLRSGSLQVLNGVATFKYGIMHGGCVMVSLASSILEAVCTVVEGYLGVSVKAPMQPCVV